MNHRIRKLGAPDHRDEQPRRGGGDGITIRLMDARVTRLESIADKTSETLYGMDIRLTKIETRFESVEARLAETATKADHQALSAKLDNMATKAEIIGLATKADLAGFATKEDLAGFATKADLLALATKAELQVLAGKVDTMATKVDLQALAGKVDTMATKDELHKFREDVATEFGKVRAELGMLRTDLVSVEKNIIKWMMGAVVLAQLVPALPGVLKGLNLIR